MEKWNAYTRDGQLTDKILIRGEEIPEGHVFHGLWSAGAAILGEDKYSCIKREMEEETGIFCNEFQEIGCDVDDESHCIFYGFVCTVDCDKDSVKLQEGETEGYVWMSEADFIEFVNSGKMIPPQQRRYHAYFEELGYIR